MRLWFLDTRTSLNQDDGTVWWLSNAQEELVIHYTMCCWWSDTQCLLKKNLSPRYVVLVCYALLSNAQEELVSHRCFGIKTQSASGEDDEAFLVGLITMLFTRKNTIGIQLCVVIIYQYDDTMFATIYFVGFLEAQKFAPNRLPELM